MITYCKEKYTNWVSHLSAGVLFNIPDRKDKHEHIDKAYDIPICC